MNNDTTTTTTTRETYCDLVERILGAREVDESICALNRMAQRLDNDAKIAADHADWLAKNFARYAAEVREGRVYQSTPMSSSAALDLVAAVSRYSALKEAFEDAFYAITDMTVGAARKGQS